MTVDDHIVTGPFNMSCQPDTPIDWFLGRMKASGITESIANSCGIVLHISDSNNYFTIPYFDRHGVQTTLTRRRNRFDEFEHGPDQSGGNFKGKYTQPKGSKNQVYWPPVADQSREYKDTLCPLIACEGELKAICCKMHIRAQGEGHEALVVGIPGTNNNKTVFDELRNINMYGPNDTRRIVFISTDWNNKGKGKENSAKLEFDLRKLFEEEGAKVVILRWPIPEGEEENEQKLDDWLVAGGDIGTALRYSFEIRSQVDSVFQQHWDYLNSHYAIKDGKYIPLADPSKLYTQADLNTMENGVRIEYAKNKFYRAHDVWALQPKEDRNEVDGYIFLPAPLGVDPELYVHDKGRRLLNTAPIAHWHSPPWGTVQVPDIAPFRSLVERLCQESADWFLDFLAHIAQRPAERGNHIIIFKDGGGTGKSRLFEILDLVFGEYSGPIGTALTSNFNSQIEKLLIAWWSDPVTHGGANRDLESALKNFSGDSKLSVNHKYGAEYTVTGYGRLMIATNKWIVPVDSKERRYTVFGGLRTLDHADARSLMDWARAGGVEQIRLFLVDRDISKFDIYAPGPRTAQRLDMELCSAHPMLRMLTAEPFDRKDVWRVQEIADEYKNQHRGTMNNKDIGVMLNENGFALKLTDAVTGKSTKYYAIRNKEFWETAPGRDWVLENQEKFEGKQREGTVSP